MLKLSRTEDVGRYATPKQAASGSRGWSLGKHLVRWLHPVIGVKPYNKVIFPLFNRPLGMTPTQEPIRFEEF
jgi:hypothetical protein